MRACGSSWRQIAPEWSALAALLPAPWLLELERPAGISASFRADQTLVEGQGSVALASAGPRSRRGRERGPHASGPDGGLRELVVPDGEIGLQGLRLAGMRVDRGTVRLDGAGSAAGWQGELELELIGAGEPAPGLRLEGVSARAGLDARFADGRLSLLAREPGTLRLEQLSTGAGPRRRPGAPMGSERGAAAQRGVPRRRHRMAAAPGRAGAGVRGGHSGAGARRCASTARSSS